jgi:predicted transcriptional regulator
MKLENSHVLSVRVAARDIAVLDQLAEELRTSRSAAARVLLSRAVEQLERERAESRK